MVTFNSPLPCKIAVTDDEVLIVMEIYSITAAIPKSAVTSEEVSMVTFNSPLPCKIAVTDDEVLIVTDIAPLETKLKIFQ